MQQGKRLSGAVAEAYAKAGTEALKKFGVHHLSKTSLETLTECAQKFHLKGSYEIVKNTMLLGQICHSVLEQAADALMPFTDASLVEGKEIDMTDLMKKFAEFRSAVFSRFDIGRMLLDSAQEQLDRIANSSKEVLYADGGNFRSLADEIISTVETIGKSYSREHLETVLDGPVLGSEIPVAYFYGEIPYLGYIDLLKLDASGSVRVVDLKTTFSNNQYIWQSTGAKFQLWLYAKALRQMKVIDYMPAGEIDRLVVDLGTKRKIKPTSYTVKIERKILENLDSYTPKFESEIMFAEKTIKSGAEIFAHSQYGCGSCEYKDMCEYKITPDDWKDLEEVKNEKSQQ